MEPVGSTGELPTARGRVKNRNRAIVTGTIAAALFVLAAVRQVQISGATLPVEATVVGNVESKGRGTTHWCPQLRWSYGGEERVTTSTSCEREPYPIDGKLRLLVDPDDPHHYVIDDFAPLYAIQLTLVVFGALVGAYAVAFLRRYRRACQQAALDEP